MLRERFDDPGAKPGLGFAVPVGMPMPSSLTDRLQSGPSER